MLMVEVNGFASAVAKTKNLSRSPWWINFTEQSIFCKSRNMQGKNKTHEHHEHPRKNIQSGSQPIWCGHVRNASDTWWNHDQFLESLWVVSEHVNCHEPLNWTYYTKIWWGETDKQWQLKPNFPANPQFDAQTGTKNMVYPWFCHAFPVVFHGFPETSTATRQPWSSCSPAPRAPQSPALGSPEGLGEDASWRRT